MPSFDGEIAKIYVKFFDQIMPSWKHHVAALKAHGVTSPENILDIASGPGQPGCLLAETFPDAKVRCTDLAPDMVSQAEARVKALGISGRVTCQVLDMQSMSGISDASMDVVTVSFGLMFAPNLAAALSEIHRVLVPGGVMTASVWLEMPMIPMLGKVMTKVLGHSPPPPPINPLSLAAEEALRIPLSDAGFDMVSDEKGTLDFSLGSDPEESWKMGTLPVASKLKEMEAEGKYGDVMSIAKQAFEEEVASWKDVEGVVRVPTGTYRLVICVKT